MIPIKAKTGVNEDGFRRLINRLELCIPRKGQKPACYRCTDVCSHNDSGNLA